MFDAKKLSQEQVLAIKEWAEAGDQLQDIQKKLEQDFELKLTYMDTRFLALDLGIEIHKQEQEDKTPDTQDDLTKKEEATPTGEVSITVDEVVRPGVMISGRVTFSDTQTGIWYIDQMGRLGIDPDTAGYRPNEQDIATFQTKLKEVMEKK